MEAQMELPQDLKHYSADEPRGFFTLLVDIFGTVLGVVGILLLVIVALGWA